MYLHVYYIMICMYIKCLIGQLNVLIVCGNIADGFVICGNTTGVLVIWSNISGSIARSGRWLIVLVAEATQATLVSVFHLFSRQSQPLCPICLCVPGAHFTIIIQIQWEFQPALIHIDVKWSLWHFAQGTTTVLL